METIRSLAVGMPPDAALLSLAETARELLAQVDEESRLDFITALLGDSGGDRVSSMVHL